MHRLTDSTFYKQIMRRAACSRLPAKAESNSSWRPGLTIHAVGGQGGRHKVLPPLAALVAKAAGAGIPPCREQKSRAVVMIFPTG